ncbi:hypothetical protein BSKO_11303 [Bryopsis sp. KO-2023]|nr:hypothetical protein BSKO_11303 [Bryopsis sp. KO-2023]
MGLENCSGLLCFAVLIACGCYGIWSSRQPFQCEMTFMYPQYDKVFTKGKFSLYRYHEKVIPGGRKQPQSGSLPALFVPGNSGSYKQVRSIAGESARQFRKRHADLGHDLTWFVADFNEEFSAFDGRLMRAQTDFVVFCLAWMKNSHSNRTDFRLAVLGHSMGGLVARAAVKQALNEGSIGPESVSVILTLASPHQHPPVMTQPAMSRFYADLSQGGCEKDVPLISIYGGSRDVQVPFVLTRFKGLITDPDCPNFEVAMSDIPTVWVEADHQCIVWCNQLIIRLASLIVDWMNGLPQIRGLDDPRSHAERIIAQCRAEFTPVSTKDLNSGTVEDIDRFGPGCRSEIPAGVSKEIGGSGATSQQDDLLYVDQATLEHALHNTTGTWWWWDWSHRSKRDKKYHFSLVAGSAKPCVGFRAWIMGADGAKEITGMIHTLPPASDPARVKPLPDTPAALREILYGRDYYAGASWYLPLDADQLQGIQKIIVWAGQPTIPDAFFIQAVAFQPASGPKPLLGLHNLFWSVRIAARVPMPVEIGVSRFVWGVFRTKVVAANHGCPQGEAWGPIVVNPPEARLGGNHSIVPTFHVLAPSACHLNVWLEAPLLELIMEYLVVKSGQLMGLCMCLSVWGMIHSRCPPNRKTPILSNLDRVDLPPIGVNWIWTSLGPVGVAWIAFVLIAGFEGFRGSSLVGGWPVRWGLWAQPPDTRYPVMYACFDSIFAYGLMALSKWFVEKLIDGLSYVVFGLSYIPLRLADKLPWLRRGWIGSAHQEARMSQPGVKMKIFLVSLAAFHPGVASLIAFATLAVAWRSVQGKSGQKKRDSMVRSDLMIHFWGFLLWLPSLIAWLRVAPQQKNWFLSDLPLWLPCILHGLHFENRVSSSRRIVGSLLASGCLIVVLAFVLDGYSSVAVYLYSIECLLDLLAVGSTAPENQGKEE